MVEREEVGLLGRDGRAGTSVSDGERSDGVAHASTAVQVATNVRGAFHVPPGNVERKEVHVEARGWNESTRRRRGPVLPRADLAKPKTHWERFGHVERWSACSIVFPGARQRNHLLVGTDLMSNPRVCHVRKQREMARLASLHHDVQFEGCSFPFVLLLLHRENHFWKSGQTKA